MFRKSTPLLIIALFVQFTWLSSTTTAQLPDTYRTRWENPELQRRIDEGIEKHRKGDAMIELVGVDGRPVPDVEVRVEQTRHAFLFGCNAFVLGQLDTPEKNDRYEKTFTKLFNFATVPFYWRGTEPAQGELCYAEGSRTIWRRPPPDRFRAFGEKYGVTLKGHPLLWHAHNPDWLPKDAGKLKTLYKKRLREIAPRYSDHIRIWDVVNESLVCPVRFRSTPKIEPTWSGPSARRPTCSPPIAA